MRCIDTAVVGGVGPSDKLKIGRGPVYYTVQMYIVFIVNTIHVNCTHKLLQLSELRKQKLQVCPFFNAIAMALKNALP